MPHILVVCTANICRSPVAEAVLRDRLRKRGLEQWTVGSAGTWALVERGAAYYSVQFLAEAGLDLSNHQARMIEESHLREADLILCTESGHVEALKAEFAAHKHKIYLLSEMVGEHDDIQDPYGLSRDHYRTMIAEVTEIIDSGLDRIIELTEKNAANRDDN